MLQIHGADEWFQCSLVLIKEIDKRPMFMMNNWWLGPRSNGVQLAMQLSVDKWLDLKIEPKEKWLNTEIQSQTLYDDRGCILWDQMECKWRWKQIEKWIIRFEDWIHKRMIRFGDMIIWSRCNLLTLVNICHTGDLIMVWPNKKLIVLQNPIQRQMINPKVG